MGVILVGGGARSGKSRFALEYAEERYTRRAFLATAQALDEEMQARIERHQAERGSGWTTIEEPIDIGPAIVASAGKFDVMVIDCLTLWLSNIMLDSGRDEASEIGTLVTLLGAGLATDVVVITNEVGCGIVPENALARKFRDLSGEMNQAVARAATEVYWMVLGYPVQVKVLPQP